MTYRPPPLSFIWFIGSLSAAAVLTIGGCGSTPVVQEEPAEDQELKRFSRAAHQAFDMGKLRQAANFYRKALVRAYIGDDSRAIVDAQYNLAVCLVKLQAYEEALGVVHQAKAEMTRAGQSSSGDLLLLEATILLRMGRSEQAWKISDQILAATPRASSTVQNKTYFLRGLIANQRGDIAKLREAIVSLGEPTESQLQADRWELLGYVAMDGNDWARAVEAFDQAAELRREALDFRSMVRVVALAGGASERAGWAEAAAVRYLRAGRSAALQGDNDNAQHWLIKATQLARQAGDDQVAQESRAYLKQIHDTQESSDQ